MRLIPPLPFRFYAAAVILPAAFWLSACQLPLDSGPALGRRDSAERTRATESRAGAPALEIDGAVPADDDYRVLSGAAFTLAVTAPGAAFVEMLYRPVTTADRTIKLRTVTAPDDDGRFTAEMRRPADFHGEVWARARYADGEVRQTARVMLVSPADAGEIRAVDESAAPNETAAADDNESARADVKTGGRVRAGALRHGAGALRLTVNVPAFLLTVWQNDREIERFYVGVGRQNYPLRSGLRAARRIVLNPDWIPPDTEWVRAAGLESLERIPATSEDKPLGKIKISLGDAYLLHEAEGAGDIGRLVSHGCVRVMRDDIFELARLLVAARGLLPEHAAALAAARRDEVRRVIELGGKIPVDINYDTMVVEEGVLHIYPDVYEQKTNTVEELRAELEKYKLDVSRLDDATLRKMLDSVTNERQFVVALADVRAGRALEKGRTEPLTPFRPRPAAREKNRAAPPQNG